MFQLTAAEKAEVVANCDHLARLKFAKVLPFAFTADGGDGGVCGASVCAVAQGDGYSSH